jgi:hypothetical protein
MGQMTTRVQRIQNYTKNRQQRTAGPETIRALQAAYRALNKADDPRVDLGNFRGGKNEREQRIAWAIMNIGRQIESFSDLREAEAHYLLDYCNGRKTKLDTRIDLEMQRLGIHDPAKYFIEFCKPRTRHSRTQWSFGWRNFHQLHFADKYHLVNILATRMPTQVQAELRTLAEWDAKLCAAREGQ